MSDRNEQIVAAVKGGLTYGEAAAEFGVTRNVVAGVCQRAGLRVGRAPERLAKAGNRNGNNGNALRAYWQDKTAEERSEHGRWAINIRWSRQRARSAGARSGL